MADNVRWDSVKMAYVNEDGLVVQWDSKTMAYIVDGDFGSGGGGGGVTMGEVNAAVSNHDANANAHSDIRAALQNDYSLDEQPTGRRWIDGKLIYQRTFTGSAALYAVVIIGNIANLSSVVSVSGYLYSFAGNYLMFPWYNNLVSPTETVVAYVNSNGNVSVQSNINESPVTVTVEYTKV